MPKWLRRARQRKRRLLELLLPILTWTSGDEDGPSARNLLTNMSTMLVALTSRVDGLDPAADVSEEVRSKVSLSPDGCGLWI